MCKRRSLELIELPEENMVEKSLGFSFLENEHISSFLRKIYIEIEKISRLSTDSTDQSPGSLGGGDKGTITPVHEPVYPYSILLMIYRLDFG